MSTDCCADPAATLDTVTQPFDPSALFGGGQGGENPMAGLLAQAQQMQEKLLAAQDEIASAEIVGSAGNGLVTVTGNGTGEVTKVSIDPKIVDPDDVETLQDLLLGASRTSRASVSSSPARRWVRWPEVSAAASPGSAAEPARPTLTTHFRRLPNETRTPRDV